jgi:hypothetical protein
VSYEDNQLLFRKELKRNWAAEQDNLVQASLAYLNQYTSAGNTSAQQYVTDPMANRLTYSGRWRLVSNEKVSFDNEAPTSASTVRWSGITQTLRYGYADTLAWDEARLVSNEILASNTSSVTAISNTTSDNPGDVIVVEWVNLNPIQTRTMSTSGILSGYTITSPVVRGVTYTGDWHRVAVMVSESELTDGSGRVRVVLARPQYTLNAYETALTAFYGATQTDEVHYLWNVPRDLAQTIINDWKDDSRSAAASLNSDNTVNLVLRRFDPGATPIQILADVARISCSATTMISYFWDVTNPDASAYDITTQVYAEDPGYTYSKSISFNRERATFNVEISMHRVTARSPYTSLVMERGTRATTTRTLKLGQLGAITATTTPAAIGTIYRKTVNVADDCSHDDVEEAITSVPSEPITGTAVDVGHLFSTAETQKYDMTAAPDALGAAEATKVKRISIRYNDDGTFNSVKEVITSTAYAEVVSHASPKGTIYYGKYQNYAGASAQAAVTAFIAATGISALFYRIGVSYLKNNDGTFNVDIDAHPNDVSISGKSGDTVTYTGFTYWTRELREVSVKDPSAYDEDAVVIKWVPIYYCHTVEYLRMGTGTDKYTEADAYSRFRMGIGGSIHIVDDYYRVEFIIGQFMEDDPANIKTATVAIGDIAQFAINPQAMPATYTRVPPDPP